MSVPAMRLLGIGSPLVDYTVNISEEHLAELGGIKGGTVHISGAQRKVWKQLCAPHSRRAGGSVANTMYVLGNLGENAAFAGKAGNDDDGDFFHREMTAAGVDLSRLSISADGNTGCCFNLITPDGERTMRSDLGISGTLSVAELQGLAAGDYDILYWEGYLLEYAQLEALLAPAKAAGKFIAMDLSSPEAVQSSGDTLPRLLKKYVDLVFGNELEFASVNGGENAGALEQMMKYCPVAVLKCGAAGSIIGVSGTGARIKVPAPMVPVADTVAAGDHYAAGFLYGLAHRCPLPVCGNCAAAAAAAAVQVSGSKLTKKQISKLKIELERLRS